MAPSECQLRHACRVVVVNWNSGPRLQRCVRSIPKQFEVVVVDNASRDFAPQLDPRPDLAVIRNNRNEGFAGAANRGAAGCTREFMLFVNPDVSFADECSADPLLILLRERPTAAAATGRLVAPSAASHEGMTRPDTGLVHSLPTLSSALANVLFFDELFGKSRPHLSATVVSRIEQAPGACFMIRRSVFEELEGFDSSFYPAWFEDVDLCKRLFNRGLEILYQPRAVFHHEGGYSTGQMGRRRFNRIFYGNMIRYFRKHHGLMAAMILGMAVALGNVLRGILYHSGRGEAHD